MDPKATIACAAGVCLGIALFYGAAGSGGRLLRAAPPGPAGAPVEAWPALVAPPEAREPEADADEAVGPTTLAASAVHRSRIFDALEGGGGFHFGERVVRLGSLPDPLPEVNFYVIAGVDEDRDAAVEVLDALRDARPHARLAFENFLPGAAGAEPEAVERDARTLASVDALAMEPPSGASSGEIERFFDEAGRSGRRVFSLLRVPRERDDVPAWDRGFAGARAAGVGVILMGARGGDPDVEAEWKDDVAVYRALQRRLGNIAYD